MLHLPILRWGQPYESLEKDEVVHFSTGDPIATVSRANGGLIQRDARKAHRAREVLREIPIDDLIARAATAGGLYTGATPPIGDGTPAPQEVISAPAARPRRGTSTPAGPCRWATVPSRPRSSYAPSRRAPASPRRCAAAT